MTFGLRPAYDEGLLRFGAGSAGGLHAPDRLKTMPLYEYECNDCEHRFERIQKFSDPLLSTCPVCDGAVRKLLSSPAIQFKGSGWYVTDYARKPGDGKKDGGEARGDGKKDGGGGKKDGASPSKDASSAGAKPASDSAVARQGSALT